MDAGPSFASRRPAATGLPAFSLPPPDIPSTKHPVPASLPTASSLSTPDSNLTRSVLSPLSMPASAQTVLLAPTKPPSLAVGVSSFLTPPQGLATDGLSPLSSGVNTASSMGSQPGTTAGHAAVNYSYIGSGGSWPAPQHSSTGSYPYAGSGGHNSVHSPLLNQPYSNARSMYQQVSPSMSHFPQSSGRQMSDGLLPPVSYQQTSPVFLTPISGSGGGGSNSHNTTHQIPPSQSSSQSHAAPTGSGPAEDSYRAAQQQQQYHHQQSQQHQQQQQGSRTPLPGLEVNQSQQHAGLQYPFRTTPQQQTFPTFQSTHSQQPQPSPTTRSPPTPSSEGFQIRRTIRNPMDGGPHSGPGPMGVMPGVSAFGGNRQGSMSFGYQMSGAGGPIMTNLHQPNTPMVAVGGMMGPGGFGPGGGGPPGGPHGLHVYGQPHQQQMQQDRPFKCDQCNHSFSRNHDLKRHKRIHMAVKPFPCTFCDKAFSRKDALKRHRLVKGCGERSLKGEDVKGEDSPPDRSDIMSDTTDGSPTVTKREPM